MFALDINTATGVDGIVDYKKGVFYVAMDADTVPNIMGNLPPEFVIDIYNGTKESPESLAGTFVTQLEWGVGFETFTTSEGVRQDVPVYTTKVVFPNNGTLDLTDDGQNKAFPGTGYQHIIHGAPEGTAIPPSTACPDTVKFSISTANHLLPAVAAIAMGAAAGALHHAGDLLGLQAMPL